MTNSNLSYVKRIARIGDGRRYVIYNSALGFLEGFNSAREFVIYTADEYNALAFRSYDGALAFLERYSGAGYGLSADDCSVITANI